MKNDHQKVIDLPITGRDELNVCECPLTLLTDKAEEGQKTLEFTDRQQGITRHWVITGSDKYGLPCALDEPVFIAMLALTKRDGFKGREVHFNPYEMLKLMNWPNNGKHYDRLGLALDRLHDVSIHTDYLWDRGQFKKCKASFHIIDNFLILKGKKNTKNSYFRWDDEIFRSFINGNLKNLELETYFSLKTPISKRFYRLWDKWLYKNEQISFDLQELCHEKLGISRSIIYPSSLKQKLEQTLKEHKERKLLSSATYFKKKDGNWMLNIKRYKENPAPLPEPLLPPEENQPKGNNPLLEQLLTLKIPMSKAQILIESYPKKLIADWIMAIDLVKPLPKNKAGYIIKALEEQWELPAEVKEKKEAEEQQQEEKLKDEYEKYIIFKVDEYLKTLDPQQVEKEIEEHEEIFYSKYPHYGEFKGYPSVKPYIQYDYKRTKAIELNLPTFDQWRSKNK